MYCVVHRWGFAEAEIYEKERKTEKVGSAFLRTTMNVFLPS